MDMILSRSQSREVLLCISFDLKEKSESIDSKWSPEDKVDASSG